MRNNFGEKKWKIQSSVKLTVSIFGKCHLGSFLVVGWKKERLWCQIHQFLLPSCPWADQRLFSLTQIQLYWTPLFIIKYNYGINIKFKVTFSQVVLNESGLSKCNWDTLDCYLIWFNMIPKPNLQNPSQDLQSVAVWTGVWQIHMTGEISTNSDSV